MNPSAIAIALTVFFILVMFWNSLKANAEASAELPEPGPAANGEQPPSAQGFGGADWEAVDLRQFLHSLQESYETTLAYLGIRLDLELPAMPLTVGVRRADLRRLFAHIIRVICDAPARGVTLRILARSDGSQAVVNCIDEGGVTEPRLAKAFGRPDHLHASSVDACHSIVDVYGGRVYAAPSPLGQHSLTVRFPLRRMRETMAGRL